jgi:hypothetical protein
MEREKLGHPSHLAMRDMGVHSFWDDLTVAVYDILTLVERADN